MNCIYSYQGKVIGDFLQLLEYLDAQDISTYNDVSDIIFSRAKQEGVSNQLKEIREDYIKKYKEEEAMSARTSSMYEDELGNPNGISAQEILDDPRCLIDGKPIVTPYNEEDYIRVEAANIVKKENWDESRMDEAREQVKKEIENHDKLREISVTLHKLIDAGVIKADEATFLSNIDKKIEGTMFEGNDKVLKSLHKQTHDFIKQLKELHGKDCTIINNVGVKGKALGEDIYGHIDYLVVDRDGRIHMYMFKASTKPYYKWSEPKIEKYRYYAAFLKQLLAQNDVDVNNMALNIVPVIIDTDYNVLNGVSIRPIQDLTVSGEGKYVMDKYDKHARFIVPSQPITPNVSSADFNKALSVCQFIAPSVNLKQDGVHSSVDELIRNAPESGESEPLTINRLPEGNYVVTINGKEYTTKSTKPKNSNPEIRELLEQHVQDLVDGKQATVATLKNAIVSMSKESDPNGLDKLARRKGLSAHSAFIQAVMRPYTSDYSEEDGEKSLNWTVIEDLLDQNILLIANKLTGQLDVIVLSPYHTDAKIDFHKGVNTILGRYRRDIEAYGVIRNTYGNLETLRGIMLLNEILPKLDQKLKLGNIKVISHLGSSQSMSIADVTRTQLPQILQVVKEENSELEVKNNFQNLSDDRFMDPIESIVREFNRITSIMTEGEKEEYAQGNFRKLFDVKDQEDTTAKIVALKNLLAHFGNLDSIKHMTYQQIIDTAERDRNSNGDNCRLYLSIERALHYYQGTVPKYEGKLSTADKKMSTTTHVGNENIRIVTEGAAITFNAISEQVEDYHSKNIRDIVREFQDAKGYTTTRNAVIGDENSIFQNLYELDDDGNRTMRFKNPYTDPSLNESERQFIKKVTYQLYLIRNGFEDVKELGGYDKTEQFMHDHPDFLWVPLCRAESSTKVHQNFQKKTWAGRFKRMINVLKNPERWYDDFVEKVSETERRLYEEDREHLSIRNPFSLGETEENRKRWIAEEGVDYFETNVDNILVNYLYQKIKTEKLNDYLVSTKAFMVEMAIMGKEAGTASKFNEQLEYIEDFLKVNVYNTSIKSDIGRYITGIMTPLRTQTTLINLGGNIISFFRDVFQGFQENFMRGVLKLNTDLQPKYIKDAYAYVITHGMTNTMNIDMLSKLQTKYRLSNIDLASSESLKLGRGGVVNYRNWAYSTLRRPDFLNRMTLFVARCMQDGVWDAYSIKDDQLVYDWKKDKRFVALINGSDKNSKEYKEAKALYMSKIREWNEEHPEQQLPYSPDTEEEGLPTPYSNKEILAIKGVADNIYGAYDKVLKGMAEHETIMWFFGMYTTWMNGIWSNYFMKPGKYTTTRVEPKQMTDESGRPLFWTESFEQTTEDTGMPIYTTMPTITQGIWYTLKDMYYLIEEDGWKAAYDFYKANPQTKANMRKLISDQLMFWLIIVLLKSYVIDPSYKDYKKEMKDNPVAVNLLAEVMYKSSTRSWDSFQGPINYLSWIFQNNDSPIYEVNTKILKDATRVIYGDKSVADAVIGNFAFTRVGKDTYSAWKKTQE